MSFSIWGPTMLTESQRESILSYFFTTASGRVACATDKMPSSLWAYLVGSYSRSHEPIRERLLTCLFSETGLDADVFAQAISTDTAVLVGDALAKAESFLRKWAVEYGHNSLKDSACDRFAVEGCSILAAKAFEDTELSAFQEKSTRYLDFSNVQHGDLIHPDAISGHSDYPSASIFDDLLDAYRSVLAYWVDVHYNESDPSLFVNDAARARTARAKAFDKARYLLPVSIRTSFGATMPTRDTERVLSRMLAHPLKEVRDIASEVLLEVRKIHPGLFSRVVPTDTYDSWCLPLSQEECFSLITHNTTANTALDTDPFVTLQVGPDLRILIPNNLTNCVASAFTSFALRRMNTADVLCPILGTEDCVLTAATCSISDVGAASVLKIAERLYRESRPTQHSPIPRYLDHVQVTINARVDYGAYRDLQRHRAGRQDIVRFVSGFAYFDGFDSMPSELIDKCLRVISVLDSARRRIMSTYAGTPSSLSAYELDYLHILGDKVSWVYTCSLRQLVYLVELRTQPAGHSSYRRVASNIATALEGYIPWLFLHKGTGEQSRVASENRTQQKLAALGTAT